MGKTNRVAIGVYCHDEPVQLQATLNSILAHTAQPFELVLLVDGPTLEMSAILQRYTGMARIVSTTQRGAAASFNALYSHVNAQLYAFIESGTLPGPQWLVRLQGALQVAPGHGLAGPSTNLCWNEQGRDDFDSAGDTRRVTEALALRYGSQWQTLEPLYSLNAFCYLVRREVIETVGAADESYACGPGWEMDYNIRAARAGFCGIWVKGAYAYRQPLTPARLRAEENGRIRAKRLYQDRYCGLRAVEPASPYADHCTGDACGHFAAFVPGRMTQSEVAGDAGWQFQSPATASPLVSCVMPTRGRARWVEQAIRLFQRQDYPKKELVIVYDHDADITPRCADPRVRYVKATGSISIGAKRQLGTTVSRGEIIAQWDDDDWYAPSRITQQVIPIRLGVADITGLGDTLFFDIDQWQFWRCSPALYAQLFVEQVAGGTLVYRRELWQQSEGYKDISLREDAEFLLAALRHGGRLCRVDGGALYLYLRHGNNTWRFTTGQELLPHAWQRVKEPEVFMKQREYYVNQHSSAKGVSPSRHNRPVANTGQDDSCTLVSCIMPTSNRRDFVPRAIRLFQQQDYPNRELIIIDDGDDAISDLIPDDPQIRYWRNHQRKTTGAKRNQACQQARGDIIVHWDDDDWMAPGWLSLQVKTLQLEQADICGMSEVLFYEPDSRQAWLYQYDGGRPWVCGGTLCYTRSYWHRNPFPDITIGEDNAFVWSRTAKRVVTHGGSELYIATVHGRNTSPKNTLDRRWERRQVDLVEAVLLRHGETVPYGNHGRCDVS